MSDTSLLSRREVADRFKVHPRTVFRWEKEGLLTPVRVGSRIVRYDRQQVEDLIQARKEDA